MIISAIITIAAVSSLVVLADSEAVGVLQEKINYLVIIRQVLQLLLCDSCKASPTFDLHCLKGLLVCLFILIKEGVMLDDIVNIIYLWVILRLNHVLLRNVASGVRSTHHHLRREINAGWYGTSHHRLS